MFDRYSKEQTAVTGAAVVLALFSTILVIVFDPFYFYGIVGKNIPNFIPLF
jgi:hypothetical protein